MKTFKTIAASAVMAATMLGAGAASAATYLFDSVGDSYTINFDGSENGVNFQGLSTSVTYTLTGFSGNSATFSYSLDNTSTSPTTAARVTSFGFDINKSITSSSVLTGTTFANKSSGNVPNNLPDVDFCLTSGNNCSGGGNGGETISAAPATGSFKLNFSNQPSAVTLSNLYVRYQGVYTTGVYNSSATGVPTSAVPEPATWAVMLMGFGGLGAMLRQRRRGVMAMVRA